MASRIYHYAESLSRTTSTTTDYSTVKVSKPFLPNASKTYAIIWSAVLDGNLLADLEKVRVQNTTAAATLAEQTSWVRNTTVATSNFAVGGLALYTAGGSPSSQTIEIQVASGTGALTLGVQEARLLIIELVDSVDIWASSVAQSDLLSTTYTTKVSTSWTPGSAGDYLTLASAEVLPGGGNGEEKARLNINSGTIVSECANFDYDAGDSWMPYPAAYRHIGITGATTAELQYGGITASQVSIRNAYIVSLRLDRFDSSFWAENRTAGTSTSATYADFATASGTPSAVEYGVIACGNCDLTTGTNYASSVSNRIAVGGTGQGAVFSHSSAPSSPYLRHWFQVLKRTESAVSTAWSTQGARSVGTGTARYDEHVLAVVQLDAVVSGGTTFTVPAAASVLKTNFLDAPSAVSAPDAAQILGLYRGLFSDVQYQPYPVNPMLTHLTM